MGRGDSPGSEREMKHHAEGICSLWLLGIAAIIVFVLLISKPLSSDEGAAPALTLVRDVVID
jgi:hypothetical protein